MKKISIVVLVFTVSMSMNSLAEEFNWLNMSGNLLIAGGVFVSLSEYNCEAGFASHEGRCLSTSSTNPNDPVYTKKTKGDIGKGIALALAGLGIKYLSTHEENNFNSFLNTNSYLQNIEFKINSDDYSIKKIFNF